MRLIYYFEFDRTIIIAQIIKNPPKNTLILYTTFKNKISIANGIKICIKRSKETIFADNFLMATKYPMNGKMVEITDRRIIQIKVGNEIKV